MSGKVKIGVIGAGGIANQVHFPSLSEIEGCEIVAVCDLVESKAQRAAEKYGIPKVYKWHQDMIKNEELDAVYCLVQCDLMYRVASDCISAGKNLFMEKPAGINLYQAESLKRQADAKGVINAVGMNRRFIPLVTHVLDIMRNLTEITQIDGCFIKFVDIAKEWHYWSAFVCDIIHAIDLVRYIADSDVVSAATAVGKFNSPVDNAWSSIMKFENGITGTLKSNYQTAARIHTFEIHGPKASAYINLGFPGTAGCDATIIHSSGKSIYSQAAVGTSSQLVEHIDGIELSGGNNQLYAHYGYKQEDIEFIDCIKNNKKPSCTLDDAVKSMELVELLLKNSI